MTDAGTNARRDEMLRLARLGRKKLALQGAACVLALCVVLAVLAKWEPDAYRPAVIPQEKHQEMRNHLIAAEQAFTENLRADAGPFTYHIYQDDINQWLAMRHEIYPAIDDWMPEGLSAPFILFEEDSITLMGRYTTGTGDVLLSMDLTLSMRDDDLVLRVAGLRCGMLGVPKSFVGGIGEPIERDSGDTWPGSPVMSGDLADGLRLNAEAWWKNGGIAYRVQGVRVQDGRLDLDIEPLGRRVQRRASNQRAVSAAD